MNFFGLVVVVLFCIWLWEKYPGPVMFVGALLGGAIVYFVFTSRKEAREYQEMLARSTPEERARHERARQEQVNTVLFGAVVPQLVCPHCTVAGQVRSKVAVRSTTSVTNTIAKVSATTNQQVTQRHCDNCQSTWDI